MKNVVSVAHMRKSDEATIKNAAPSLTLMRRAGEGIYAEIQKRVSLEGKIVILCGSGNNAGDGFVLADLLFSDGKDVNLFLCSDHFSEDGLHYYEICQKKGIPALTFEEDLPPCNILIDCLLGTGFKGEPRGKIAKAIACANQLREDNNPPYIVSADINSGLNGDTGLSHLCVKSDLTVSIGLYKTGLFLGQAKDVIGELTCIDIGIPPLEEPFMLLEKEDLAPLFPKRLHHSNKGTYGYVALLGGSFCYSGAITLASMGAAAMRTGAGVVMCAAPRSLCESIRPHILECTLYPCSENQGDYVFQEEEIERLCSRVRTLSVGMGLGSSDQILPLISYLLTHFTGTLLIDADGLNALSGIPIEKREHLLQDAVCKKVILTPHPGEAARLMDTSVPELLADPLSFATSFARKTGVILLLKGETTIITDGTHTYLSASGCPGMATAGSGDVLSGILTAILACNEDNPLLATAAGALLNGLSGELAQKEKGATSMLASDTVSHISEVIKNLT